MPEIRRYKVVQTREVIVVANTHEGAVCIASAAFEHGQDSNGALKKDMGPQGVWGNTDSHIKEVSLHCDRTS